jgi:hypothetical protein
MRFGQCKRGSKKKVRQTWQHPWDQSLYLEQYEEMETALEELPQRQLGHPPLGQLPPHDWRSPSKVELEQKAKPTKRAKTIATYFMSGKNKKPTRLGTRAEGLPLIRTKESR